jgi:hypothetical protein
MSNLQSFNLKPNLLSGLSSQSFPKAALPFSQPSLESQLQLHLLDVKQAQPNFLFFIVHLVVI